VSRSVASLASRPHLWNGRSSSQTNSPSTRGITSSVSSVAAPSAAAFSATRRPAACAEPPTVAKRFSARRDDDDDDARAAVAATGEVVARHVNVLHIVPRRCPFGARGVPEGRAALLCEGGIGAFQVRFQ
jgi:hypothetical protein